MFDMLKHKSKEQQLGQAADELKELSEMIELSERNFNEVSDGDLIEAAIFERAALLKRYAYLLREFRRAANES